MLHILQGGVTNGDKKWLERAARGCLGSRSWIVPKPAMIGDIVVIYLPGSGFFATARINSAPKVRTDWIRRYGAKLESIRLIEPPIPLGIIQKRVPNLMWANYPRSITTPSPDVAAKVLKLIKDLRKESLPDADHKSVSVENIDRWKTAEILAEEFDCIKSIRHIEFCFRVGKKTGWVRLKPTLFPEGTGYYRELWVGLDSQPVGKPLQIYYGPWRSSKDHYIVIKQKTKWLLELGLSPKSRSVFRHSGKLILRHLMTYSKQALNKKERVSLVQRAMRRARTLGLSQSGSQDSIILGEIYPPGVQRKPAEAQAVLKRFILTAIAKRWNDLFDVSHPYGHAGDTTRSAIQSSNQERVWPGAKNPEYTKKQVRFEVDLERKAQRHQDHQAIINTLKDLLEMHGYKCDATPEDLRAIGEEKWIFEVKAWEPALELSAVWHAIGQVKWYCFTRADGFKPVVTLDHQPNEDVIDFAEKHCKIPLLWVDKKHGVHGGPLARRLFKVVLS